MVSTTLFPNITLSVFIIRVKQDPFYEFVSLLFYLIMNGTESKDVCWNWKVEKVKVKRSSLNLKICLSFLHPFALSSWLNSKHPLNKKQPYGEVLKHLEMFQRWFQHFNSNIYFQSFSFFFFHEGFAFVNFASSPRFTYMIGEKFYS